jgi:transposase
MLPASVRIFVCTTPQDMRRSFDRLALAARQVVGEDPQSGALFVFFGKAGRRMKILWWDRNGYCLLYKRLHQAVFTIPSPEPGRASVCIDGSQLAQLLAGVPRIKYNA